jgi:hypothetical protein
VWLVTSFRGKTAEWGGFGFDKSLKWAAAAGWEWNPRSKESGAFDLSAVL